jgi:hypothetical protein
MLLIAAIVWPLFCLKKAGGQSGVFLFRNERPKKVFSNEIV